MEIFLLFFRQNTHSDDNFEIEGFFFSFVVVGNAFDNFLFHFKKASL